MDKPSFIKVQGQESFDTFLREFFLDYLSYEGISNDPDHKDPKSLEAWRLIKPAESCRPFLVAYQSGLATMERRRVSRLYIERVVPHRDGTRSVDPALYGFTDGMRLVFFSADSARNRDDRFDLSESTWKFRSVQEKVARLHRERLQFQVRLGKKRPLIEFLFEATPLSADEGFKRYVRVVRQELMRAVLDDKRALGAVVYHLIESPEAREAGKTEFVNKDQRLKKSLEELYFDVSARLGDAIAAAVDTLLLRYVMVRFLEAYHPEAMQGLLKSDDLLKRGKSGRKVRTTGDKAEVSLFGAKEMSITSFTDTELELARLFSDALGVDVSKAKVKAKGADQRKLDFFAFDDEKIAAKTILEEEEKRESRLGGDFYLADLGRAARDIEAQLLSNPSSRGAKLIQDFLGRTGAPETAHWDFRYEDLRPQTLQDYYESSLGTSIELRYDEKNKDLTIEVGQSKRQQKELGAYYTDSRLCRYMVERTVKPLFDERVVRLRQAISSKDLEAGRVVFGSIINMSVCDPTMGSAPFLRSAFDYLSEQYLPLCRCIAEAKTTLPPLYEEVSKAFPFLASKGGHMDEDGVGRWEWYILRRILYGADIDLKAVCIACQTFALSALKYLRQGERFPSFFNLNLKLGNALISPISQGERSKLAKDHGPAISKMIKLREQARSLAVNDNAYGRLALLLKQIDEIKAPIIRDLVEKRVAPTLEEHTEDLRPFCWELEFPEIFYEQEGTVKSNPGFDVLIGNPPWEAIKFNDSEFLSSIGAVDSDVEELKAKKPNVATAYKRYRDTIEAWKKWIGESGAYERQQGGRDRNKWRLATEVSWKLTSPNGAMSLVVPSGLIGDEGAVALKQLIFSEGILDTFVSFEKENEVFSGTQGFTIFSARKSGSTTVVSHVEGLRSPNELQTLPTPIPIPLDLVYRMSPLSLTIPSIREPIDLEILSKLYSKPTLDEKIDGTWMFTPYTAEIHMGHDRKNGLITESETNIPLLTGEAISDFDVRFRDPFRHWVRPKGFTLPEVAREYRVVWRNVVGTSDPRRMVFSLCPKHFAVGHSLNYVLPEQSLAVRLFFVGILNSFVLEWRARQISRNNNMVHFVIKQLPVDRLNIGNPLFDRIASLSASLLAMSPHLRSLEKEVGVKRLDDPADREDAKAQIDVCVAKMFRLSETELEHILQRFDDMPETLRRRVLSRFKMQEA